MLSKTLLPAEKETVSTVPFAKNNEFDYSEILFWMDEDDRTENGLGLFLFQL